MTRSVEASSSGRTVVPHPRGFFTRQVNRELVHGAMGTRDGDYLELSNQWAKVFIEKRDGVYVVGGDLAGIHEHERNFDSVTAAMAYALHSLGEFQKGAFR